VATHRIVSIETGKPRGARHRVIVGVSTQTDSPPDARHWTLKNILQAMNQAERFYTEAPNGRRARVQRFQCTLCGSEHIRTHVSDGAIHEMSNLPAR
jgi:hypothetical protein